MNSFGGRREEGYSRLGRVVSAILSLVLDIGYYLRNVTESRVESRVFVEEQYKKRLPALKLLGCEELLNIKFLKIETNTCVKISMYVVVIK